MDFETRIWKAEELRFTEENGVRKVGGLAVPYNALSEDLGGFREEFLPGSLTDSLQRDIFADVEHDHNQKLGRSSKGTVSLRETPRGIYAEITLPKTRLGDDVAEEVRNGNLDAMSIAFSKPEADYHRHNGDLVRKVKKAELRAVTLTAYPAYKQTTGSLTLRSMEEFVKSEEEAKAAPEAEERAKAQAAQDEIETLRRRVDLEAAI
jgi:uncharacterized protein